MLNMEYPPMDPVERRRLIERHWIASDAGDVATEFAIYHDDVVVEYPQSGERICGLQNIRALRTSHPSKLSFHVRRVFGCGDIWISETVMTYDGRPVHMVSHMEFTDTKVSRETQYFGDPFEPPDWRSHYVELDRHGS